MNDTKHTPGPWSAEYADGLWKVMGKNQGECFSAISYCSGSSNKRGANARLIAAAPDLLEALRVILNNNESLVGEATARAAIAKATGHE